MVVGDDVGGLAAGLHDHARPGPAHPEPVAVAEVLRDVWLAVAVVVGKEAPQHLVVKGELTVARADALADRDVHYRRFDDLANLTEDAGQAVHLRQLLAARLHLLGGVGEANVLHDRRPEEGPQHGASPQDRDGQRLAHPVHIADS